VAEHAIGIDLGGTFIKAGVVDRGGRVVSRVSVPTEVAQGTEAIIGRMAQAAQDARRLAGLGWDRVAAVGIGSPGALDLNEGVVLVSPNIACLEGRALAREVRQTLDVKQLAVTLENDANAAAYGEFWAGAGRDARALVLFTLGTGIGGGIVLDGRIWHGAHGFAGELGHMAIFADGLPCGCGNHGCVEVYASATGMVRRLVEAVRGGRPTRLAEAVRRGDAVRGRDIHEAALAGDALAREVIEETGRFLGIATTNVIHIFNPDLVLFAGGMTGAGNMLLDPIRQEARRRAFRAAFERVRLDFAKLGNDAGMIGAAGWALRTSATSAS
jgi:glucokinase